jgi:hypothetical protein
MGQERQANGIDTESKVLGRVWGIEVLVEEIPCPAEV